MPNVLMRKQNLRQPKCMDLMPWKGPESPSAVERGSDPRDFLETTSGARVGVHTGKPGIPPNEHMACTSLRGHRDQVVE